MDKLWIRSCAAGLASLAMGGAAALAQNRQEEGVRAKAGEIASQPAKDVGISKTEIPPVLIKALEDPYSRAGVTTCQQLANAVKELNEVLGPDFVVGAQNNENRVAKLAEAGGKTLVNSILPFRGLVREVSGAAPAQRRLDEAIDAGFARRGFLRGVHNARGCRTRF